jgi:hypothetical protein
MSEESNLSLWDKKMESSAYISSPANYYVADHQLRGAAPPAAAGQTQQIASRLYPHQLLVSEQSYQHQLVAGGTFPHQQSTGYHQQLSSEGTLPSHQQVFYAPQQQLVNRPDIHCQTVSVSRNAPSFVQPSQQLVGGQVVGTSFIIPSRHQPSDACQIQPSVLQPVQQPAAHGSLATFSSSAPQEMALCSTVLIGGVPFYLLEATATTSDLYEDVDSDYSSDSAVCLSTTGTDSADFRRSNRALPQTPLGQ